MKVPKLAKFVSLEDYLKAMDEYNKVQMEKKSEEKKQKRIKIQREIQEFLIEKFPNLMRLIDQSKDYYLEIDPDTQVFSIRKKGKGNYLAFYVKKGQDSYYMEKEEYNSEEKIGELIYILFEESLPL